MVIIKSTFMSTKEKIILAPTDFSEVCQNAIGHGAKLAKLIDAKLCLLHVFNSDSKSHAKKEGLTMAALKDRLKKIADEVSSNYGIGVTPMVKEGALFATIEEVSKSLHSMLLVLGTHGKTGIQHLTGSYALKVVTASPSPVIVFQQRAFEKGFKNIVFPVSDTTNVRQKVGWAIGIAKLFDSKIHIFKIAGNSDESDNKIKIISNQIKESFQKNGVDFVEQSASKSGSFAEQFLYYANANKADLIMIMTQKNEFVPAFFLGPWDEKMIFNQSQIPVMCINPRELSTFFFKGSF